MVTSKRAFLLLYEKSGTEQLALSLIHFLKLQHAVRFTL